MSATTKQCWTLMPYPFHYDVITVTKECKMFVTNWAWNLGRVGDSNRVRGTTAETASSASRDYRFRARLNALSTLETSSVLLIEVSLAKHVPPPTGGQIPHARTGPVPSREGNSCLELPTLLSS